MTTNPLKYLLSPRICVIYALSTLLFCSQASAESPLFSMTDLKYEGAFKVPLADYGESSLNYSQGTIGYNPDNNSMFITGHAHHQAIAEFDIPPLVKSTLIQDLNRASAPRQSFTRILDRAPAPVNVGLGIRTAGILYLNGKLIVNVYRFYDHDFIDRTTLVVEDANNLQASTLNGFIEKGGRGKAAGWMAPIPFEYQNVLGGNFISGFTSSTRRANIYTASVGPAAYSFDAYNIVNNASTINLVPTNELIAYTLDTGLVPVDDLYNGNLNNNLWTHESEASFGMIIPGSRTYAVFGRSGGHVSGMGYGVPLWDPNGNQGHYTIDQNDKYNYYWLYDVNDLISVKNGQAIASDIKPYSVGVLNVPFQGSGVNPIIGGTYDSVNGLIYLTIENAEDVGGNVYAPVIAAFSFSTNQTPKPPSGVNVN